MLHIYTTDEWDEFIDDMCVSKRSWYILDNRFNVELQKDKVNCHEAEIQHWIASNFNYDVYCILEHRKRDLTTQEIKNIKVNVRNNNLITTVKKWGITRKVTNSEEEIEKYIDGALSWHRAYTSDIISIFSFLSEEDAMAFKMRWI